MSSPFTFHDDLPALLRPQWRPEKRLVFPADRPASVKDVIESYGLPHTEIGRIDCNGQQVGFSFPVEDNQTFDIYGVDKPWKVTSPTLLRPDPLQDIAFIVDVNVGKLAKYLRMAGFDTLYDYRWDDKKIVDVLEHENRIVLSRDLGLLKRKLVVFGRYVRTENPVEQLVEIISLLNLTQQIEPFSRCLECNTVLEHVDKNTILHRLEPLTIKYYTSFCMCPSCDKIYWQGSHRDKMEKLLAIIHP